MAAAVSSSSSSPPPPPDHGTNAHAQVSPFIGFEVDKDKIIAAMFDQSHPELSYFAISGERGVGKTTLAKKIYASPKVQEEFNVHVWLLDSSDVPKAMWMQTIGAHSGQSESEKPKKAEEVKQYLKGKRYCIVIDNCIANRGTMQHWDVNEMAAALPDDDNGSRVLLIFRYGVKIILDNPQVFRTHVVGLRSKEESLRIMMKAANLDLNLNPNAPTTGADVGAMQKKKKQLSEFAQLFLVPLCGGLPWPSRFMGTLLSTLPAELPSWKCLFVQAKTFPGGFLSLAMAYREDEWLNHSQRAAFLSFLTFSPDDYIPVHTLFLLWIAQRITDDEERAYVIMECLVQGSLVEVEERPINGHVVKVCKMVDHLVRALAIQEAKERRFVRDVKREDNLSESPRVIYRDLFSPNVEIDEHHVKKGGAFCATKIDVTQLADATCSIFNWSSDTNNNIVLSWDNASLEVGTGQSMSDVEASLKKMSTPIYLGLRNPELLPEILNIRPALLDHLKMLDVEGTPLETLPPYLLRENMPLEHLILSNTKLHEIPMSIENLKFLQTLNVSRAPIKTLPEVIGNLTNLQTLNVSGTSIDDIPDFIGNLKNLRTLDVSCTSLKHIPKVIGNITYLRTLNVSGTSIDNIKFVIIKLTNLKTLDISGTFVRDISSITELVNLKTLNVSGLPIDYLPPRVLLYVNTLDIRDTFIQEISDVDWKNNLHLRSVRASDNFEHLRGPPQSLQNSNLRTLTMVSISDTWKTAVPQLPNLRELGLSNFGNNNHGGIHNLENHWQPAFNFLKTLKNLISLKIQGTHIPVEIISVQKCPSYLETLTELWVGGSQSMFSLKGIEMPPRLKKLTLENLGFEEDPMPVLGTLEDLKFLQLRWLLLDATPAARLMGCASNLFPSLERLELYHLAGLEGLWVEKGAMPKLKCVLIRNCKTLKTISRALLERETPLQELRINSMPLSFTSRFSGYSFVTIATDVNGDNICQCC